MMRISLAEMDQSFGQCESAARRRESNFGMQREFMDDLAYYSLKCYNHEMRVIIGSLDPSKGRAGLDFKVYSLAPTV